MDKRILILDIDGTLVNDKKEITPKTKKKLIEMQQAGHILMLATGRPTPGSARFIKELKLDEFGGYLLSFNGGRIMNCKTKEILYQKILPKEVIPKLFSFAKKHHCGIISYENETVISGNGVDRYIEWEANLNHLPVKEIENFADYITFDVNKCLMTAPPKDAEKYLKILQDEFKGTLSIYRSEPYFIEIMPKDIDKAASIDRLLPLIGLKKEGAVCCGDGYNDISMISYAGIGVAMQNARDEVKAVADFVTGSNEEDGLVQVVDTFILKGSCNKALK